MLASVARAAGVVGSVAQPGTNAKPAASKAQHAVIFEILISGSSRCKQRPPALLPAATFDSGIHKTNTTWDRQAIAKKLINGTVPANEALVSIHARRVPESFKIRRT